MNLLMNGRPGGNLKLLQPINGREQVSVAVASSLINSFYSTQAEGLR